MDSKTFRPTDQWSAIRGKIKNQANSSKRQRKAANLKFDHAYAYLESFKEKSCERLPIAPPKEHPGGVRVAPFKNIGGLFKQYEDDNKSDPLAASQVASLRTFRKAFKRSAAGKTTIRFRDCKGSMSTCDACANIDVIRFKYTRGDGEFRHVASFNELLDGYERVHQNQQEEERHFADLNKLKATQELDQYGQPTFWYINPDSITETRGESPKVHTSSHRMSKHDAGNCLFLYVSK